MCAPLGGGQFLLRVTVNGVPLNILYDSGASTCFARTNLPMLANAESAQREGNRHLVEGGLKIRLGDDSNAETSACKHLRFKVGEHAHDWDYHVMQLPRGIDLIVGSQWEST